LGNKKGGKGKSKVTNLNHLSKTNPKTEILRGVSTQADGES